MPCVSTKVDFVVPDVVKGPKVVATAVVHVFIVQKESVAVAPNLVAATIVVVIVVDWGDKEIVCQTTIALGRRDADPERWWKHRVEAFVAQGKSCTFSWSQPAVGHFLDDISWNLLVESRWLLPSDRGHWRCHCGWCCV